MTGVTKHTRAIVLLSLLGLLFAGAVCAQISPADLVREYHSTLDTSASDAAIWPYYVDSAQQEFQRKYPPEMRGRVFYMMKTTSPKQVRVVKETINGDQAVLTLRPVGGDERLIGTATLRREAGEWRIEKVIWQHD